MLPGVGLTRLSRRRRVHYHGGDVASSAGAGEHHAHHHHHHYDAHAHHAAPPTGVAGPALAARIRLEEKLRGAALPSTSPGSRWSRLMRDGRSTPRQPQSQSQSTRRRDDQLDAVPATSAEPEPRRAVARPGPAAVLQAAADTAASTTTRQRRRRAELTRTLSKVDVCAVCLDEVRDREDRRVTRLPCSHKYHSECVLPWLAIHPDCPCCRALVPSADTLVHQL
ncbi:probable E3 ubiquitin-protein ligase RHY1A isoform X2 [Sorghum bicolor]|uniref:probable E3 ubiquitin-protein ligase RHY1A isoform X2 n=1 Tax=Sorghum bicolor TaxID=4558 RepID=UPI00081AB825|nr:probable E3 ubiquitin-protein ligase RHY1A isoform X2 [Sorghum bicolor]|eukprot:XP_021317528.1 probable E3 ubiquitin-protein ligase RHY1A isoform X2 [Sorghum bicolor]